MYLSAMERIFVVVPLLLLLCTAGCDVLSADSSPLRKIVLGDATGTTAITGAVQHVQLEGGFWAIVGKADGGKTKTYEPINLPASFRVDGQRVRVQAILRNDMGSIHMAGPIIEIRSIEPLN